MEKYKEGDIVYAKEAPTLKLVALYSPDLLLPGA